MNNRVVELYQKKAKWKKKRDRNFHWFWWYCIFPWLALGISTVLQILLSLVFEMDWKEDISRVLSFGNFVLIIVFCWGILYMFKVKKCSREIDKIDKELEKENHPSSF